MVSQFSTWLQQWRKRERLTQTALAKRAAVSEILIRKWEAGDRVPSEAMAAALARALRIAQAEQADFVRFARSMQPLHDGATLGEAPWQLPEPANNLPTAPTPLIGRDAELAAAAALLSREAVSFVNVIGPPGIGKTRIALAVAAQLLPQFRDGVFVVSLAAIQDMALLPISIGNALGLSMGKDRAADSQVMAHLATRRLLLVLDNLEQLPPDPLADWLATLLAACPQLKLLGTSRSMAHIRAEHVFALAPLGLPNLQHLPASSLLAHVPAIALFLDRAQAVLPSFVLDVHNARAVAELCARLDGLPLAIELAAARIHDASPAALAALSPLNLAIDGPRDLPPRQRTLRNAIAWSYGLLPEPSQLNLRALAAFPAGLAMDEMTAWSANTAAWPEAQAHHLLRAVDGRWQMFESIREFANEQATLLGEHARWQQLLVDWATQQAEGVTAGWLGPAMPELRARMDAGLPNLRAALAWCRQHEVVQGAHILSRSGLFWIYRGYLREFITLAEDFIHTFPKLDARQAVQAELRIEYGRALYDVGRAPDALAQFTISAELFERIGDHRNAARAHNRLGATHFGMYEFGVSRTHLERSLALFTELGDAWWIANQTLNLGALHGEMDSTQGESVRLVSQALATFRTLKDDASVAVCLSNLGASAFAEQRNTDAARCFAEALTLQQAAGQRRREAQCHVWLGAAHVTLGEPAQALASAQLGLKLHREVGSQQGMIEALEVIAAATAELDRPADALSLWQAAAHMRDTLKLPIQWANARAYAPSLERARRVATAREITFDEALSLGVLMA